MSKKLVFTILILISIPFLVVWLPLPVKVTSTPPMQMESYGEGDFNIVLVQPWLTPADYIEHEALKQKLESYLSAAKEANWLNDRSIVVLPEHLGTWLIANDESPLISYMPTTTSALIWVVLRNFPSFIKQMMEETAPDKVSASLFKLKHEQVAAYYDQLISDLARKYQVTIVAGSIALPTPSVSSGRLTSESGPIYNSSVVYTPEGVIPEMVKKVYPITSELGFTESESISNLSTFKVSEIELAILVCADSWYPTSYEQIGQADVIVVPSFATVDLQTPWGGYDGSTAPIDIDVNDIRKLTEGDAWQKYALAERAKKTQARVGANVFLKGRLWDMKGYGSPVIYRVNEPPLSMPAYDGPQLMQYRWQQEI